MNNSTTEGVSIGSSCCGLPQLRRHRSDSTFAPIFFGKPTATEHSRQPNEVENPIIPNRIFPETTRHKAPHKPLLLLAIMEMIGREEIGSRFIGITGEITEINALFAARWRADADHGDQQHRVSVPASF